MAELVGIAVLFFVMGTLVGLAWNSDGAIRVSDTHSGPDDVETRSRRAF